MARRGGARAGCAPWQPMVLAARCRLESGTGQWTPREGFRRGRGHRSPWLGYPAMRSPSGEGRAAADHRQQTTKDTDMAIVNTELLKQTLQHIEDHPETWDQATWRNPDAECGTACCFAGWAVTLAGGQFEGSQTVRIDSLSLPGEAVRTLQEVGIGTDGVTTIPNAAAWLLGLYEVIYDEDGTDIYLDNDPSDDLFSPDNTLDNLRYIVASLCAAAAVEKTATP